MLRQLVVSCLLAFAFAGTTEAASLRPLQLAQIIDDAALAFQGTCVDNRTEREAATGFVVTYTTFAVKEVLKGTVPATHTIKQIGGKMPGGEASYRVDGVPSFEPGREYVVLLAGVSSAGFSSPLGLAQGQFTVQKAVSGDKVGNGRDFREMTADTSIALPATAAAKALGGNAAPLRSLGLEDFKQMVRAHAGRAR